MCLHIYYTGRLKVPKSIRNCMKVFVYGVYILHPSHLKYLLPLSFFINCLDPDLSSKG